MSPVEAALLGVAAAAGGALNSIAGGGSFLTFPALVLTGISPVVANATSTVALWPGSLASAFGYREELKAEAARFRWLAALSALGGVLGALVLIGTPERVFAGLVPFLLLAATLVFTFGDAIRARLPTAARGPAMALQFLISVYGGYFGGGMGLMMLAAFTLMGMSELHRMNGLKSALGVVINGVALATFVVSGKISWAPAGVMVVGASLGGFLGASLARRIPAARVKPVVIAIGWAITAWFFWRAWVVAAR